MSCTFTFAFLSLVSFEGVCCSFLGFASAKLVAGKVSEKEAEKKKKKSRKRGHLQLGKLAAIKDFVKVVEH